MRWMTPLMVFAVLFAGLAGCSSEAPPTGTAPAAGTKPEKAPPPPPPPPPPPKDKSKAG